MLRSRRKDAMITKWAWPDLSTDASPAAVSEPFVAELMDWINDLWERIR